MSEELVAHPLPIGMQLPSSNVEETIIQERIKLVLNEDGHVLLYDMKGSLCLREFRGREAVTDIQAPYHPKRRMMRYRPMRPSIKLGVTDQIQFYTHPSVDKSHFKEYGIVRSKHNNKPLRAGELVRWHRQHTNRSSSTLEFYDDPIISPLIVQCYPGYYYPLAMEDEMVVRLNCQAVTLPKFSNIKIHIPLPDLSTEIVVLHCNGKTEFIYGESKSSLQWEIDNIYAFSKKELYPNRFDKLKGHEYMARLEFKVVRCPSSSFFPLDVKCNASSFSNAVQVTGSLDMNRKGPPPQVTAVHLTVKEKQTYWNGVEDHGDAALTDLAWEGWLGFPESEEVEEESGPGFPEPEEDEEENGWEQIEVLQQLLMEEEEEELMRFFRGVSFF